MATRLTHTDGTLLHGFPRIDGHPLVSETTGLADATSKKRHQSFELAFLSMAL